MDKNLVSILCNEKKFFIFSYNKLEIVFIFSSNDLLFCSAFIINH